MLLRFPPVLSTILLIDEMDIKEDLVYDKHSGQLIGFTNLGDVNIHLDAYEKSLNSNKNLSPTLAKSVLVFMVRRLFSKLQFAYAQFPCSSLTGDKMYGPFWEAVGRLESCGFKVRITYSVYRTCYVKIMLLC